MAKLEIPKSLGHLRRINADAYNWYMDSVLPTLDKIADRPILDGNGEEIIGLELFLQEVSPWPYLLALATESNSQYRVNIAGRRLNLRPIKATDFEDINNVCQRIRSTPIEERKVLISHPRLGLHDGQSILTYQYAIEPEMRSWIYQ